MSVARLDDGITESPGETRRQHLHLQLQLRSGRLRNGKRVGAHGNLHHLKNGGDFGFPERIPENRREVWAVPCTCGAVQSVHKRGTHRTRLAQELHDIFVRLKIALSSGLHMSHPFVGLSPAVHHEHIFFLIHPPTTTPEHALQSGQHDLLQEQPVRHQPLQERPVENYRYQEPLWRENQQSGGNPRNTFCTVDELNILARCMDHDGRSEKKGNSGNQCVTSITVILTGRILAVTCKRPTGKLTR